MLAILENFIGGELQITGLTAKPKTKSFPFFWMEENLHQPVITNSRIYSSSGSLGDSSGARFFHPQFLRDRRTRAEIVHWQKQARKLWHQAKTVRHLGFWVCSLRVLGRNGFADLLLL